MALSPTLAIAVFGLYFAVILVLFGLVIRSVLPETDKTRIFRQKPFLFLRCAVGALLSTWYFMLQFMLWSYKHDAKLHGSSTVGDWLSRTSLFEQAWQIVCTGSGSWWWSSFICTFAVILTPIMWAEGRRRGIKWIWAYMILGQLVAISVALALFLTALSLRPHSPTVAPSTRAAHPTVYLLLFAAMAFVFVVPDTVGSEFFLPVLTAMHILLVIPLLGSAELEEKKRGRFDIPYPALYAILILTAAVLHGSNTVQVYRSLPAGTPLATYLYNQIFKHPAQSSISLDVIWVFITLACWWLTTGSFVSVVIKSTVFVLAGGVVIARYTGVDWSLVLSAFPILGLLAVGVILLGIHRIRKRNVRRRKALVDKLGIRDNEVVPGTDKKPPSKASVKTLVGFFHPYCNSGGGGERVLWSAIAYLQRTQPDVVSMVYTGDVLPDAVEEGKAKIINDVKTRFSISLDPATLHFVPLPSRHLVSDGYYKRFTLLMQSLGSVYLAWEGLCGKNGLWGDIFLDSMGYAFTFPFARLIAGSTLTTGAYVHYPTVSTDMVKRVRERTAGIEDGGASKSWLKRQIKLVYYRIFTSLYATSLLFPEEVMTNSSWTQAHITNLIRDGRNSTLAGLLLLDDKTYEIRAKRGEAVEGGGPARCRVVYPPCDTEGLQKLGKLDKRTREMVSLAQFRPEKEQAKQIYALGKLFEDHPEHRNEVSLTLMGGTRDVKDRARVDELRKLAIKLGVEDKVQFLENAPWGDIAAKLGQASIGLNTMQDEHFGINVVEFMAAGLIPIVHASAGPLLDIVVPHNGQKTVIMSSLNANHASLRGFHATDAESFADAMHQALLLSNSQALKMRQSARSLAKDKFSLDAFERSFEESWSLLKRKARTRRDAVDRAELDKLNRR